MNHTPQQGQENSARRGKLRRASSIARSYGFNGPTDAQRQKLFALLGGLEYAPSPIEIECWVRMANGYTAERLSKLHYIEAIDMAINKVNSYGTLVELIEYSFDADAETTPNPGELKRRLIARSKAIKAGRYSKPTKDKTSSVKSEAPVKSYTSSRDAQRIQALELLAKSRVRKPG